METQNRTKEKRRNTEKRKEKSRFAARCRRSKESEIFADLAHAIPLQETNVHSLDKASIMRLVIAHLRIRNLFDKFTSKNLTSHIYDNHLLKAISGVILLLSTDGEIIYISPNVSSFLGLSEVDIMGQNVFDICHPCDHKEVKSILDGKCDIDGKISLFLRLKCSSSPKSRTLHFKSASYKVLHITGAMIQTKDDEDETLKYFAALGSPIPHPENIEIPLGSFTFLSKHSLDMKYTYADDRMQKFLGYSPQSLIGKSLFEFHHVLDDKAIQEAFKSLFAKGQSETDQYRFLTKGGGYVWVYTQATVIYCEKGFKPESVVCVNYVVSERLNAAEVYSSYQLNEIKSIDEKAVKTVNKSFTSTAKVITKLAASTLKEERPLPVTSKVFTPRTADMNKGYLTFDSGCTVLKDDPEDLTHLAPTAGDSSIPLGCEPYTIIIDDFSGLPDGVYSSPLLNSGKDTTLFIKCGDDCSSSSLSPMLAKSPDSSSIPSLCSATDDSTFDDSCIGSYLSNDLESCRHFNSGSLGLSSEGNDLPLLMGYDLAWFPSSSISPCLSPNSDHIMTEGTLSSVNKAFKDDSTDVPIQPFQDQGGGMLSMAVDIKDSRIVVESETRKRTNVSPESSSIKKAKKISEINMSKSSQLNDSVLMNLLFSGRDARAGEYVCINTRKKLPSNDNLIQNGDG